MSATADIATSRLRDLGRGMECILFDFGGTLDFDGVAWKDRFQSLYRDEGAVLTDRVFYDADDPLEGAMAPSASLAETVAILVDNIEARLPAQAGRGARVTGRFLAGTEATVARNRPVLAALKTRYRLGIVSNFYGNLTGVCDSLGLSEFFGAMADSEVVGTKKPEPAIFEAAMGPLGARTATTLMVGDSLHRDREGARRLGMGFVWIAPESARAAVGDVGDPVVAGLDGLLELIA